MGDLLELTIPATDRFELFSIEPDLVQAYEQDGKKKFKGIASSTTRDLHGDTITESALRDMETQAVGLTMFLNHSYNVPNDVGGTITRAIVKQKGVDQDGNPNYQLEIEGDVEDENPEALKTWRFVNKGRRIGLSIGAMIPNGGATRQKDGSLIINRLQLLEVSFVGIPANPKSWIEYAASAIKQTLAKGTHQVGNPTLTLQNGRYIIEGSLEGLDLNLGAEPEPEPVPEVDYIFQQTSDGKTAITRATTTDNGDGSHTVDQTLFGAWDLSDADEKLLAIATAGEEAVEKATVWVTTRDGDQITIGDPETASIENDIEPDITNAMCPSCGKGRDASGCSDSYHKAAPEPDVTDAKVRVIEVDTDDKSDGNQGASGSEPDDASDTLAAPEADIAAEGEPLILDDLTEQELIGLSFRQLQAIALRATTELVEAKKALGEEKALREQAEARLDEVAEAAAELVKRTAAVIERVADTPMVRKAKAREVEKTFSETVEAYYGTEFARALAGTKKS